MAHLKVNGRSVRIEELGAGPDTTVAVDRKQVSVQVLEEVSSDPLGLILRAGNRILNVVVHHSEDGVHFSVRLNGRPMEVELDTLELPIRARAVEVVESGPVLVIAPMAGRIVGLKTDVGKVVEEGQALVVLQAMKMENEVAAPRRGVVRELYVRVGSLVKLGDNLARLE